jgi:DNA-binding GntR family transcriptional regulator
VRDIFRRLAGEGYLDIRENRGARVIPMNHATLRNFFLVAPMIYAAIGRLAVQNFKPAQLVELTETQERFRGASRDQDALAWFWRTTAFTRSSAKCRATPICSRALADSHRSCAHRPYVLPAAQ